MSDMAATARVKGRVKWFDPVKGFGFVVAQECGTDVLLHANVLRNFGQNSIADGTELEMEVSKTDRGMQATEIYVVHAAPDAERSALPEVDEMDAEVVAELPLLAARVKWFDKAKGFGFANVFGASEDVFVHIEVLRRSGLSDLLPGEALALRVVDGRRGKMAVEVAAWESALSK